MNFHFSKFDNNFSISQKLNILIIKAFNNDNENECIIKIKMRDRNKCVSFFFTEYAMNE